MESPADAADEQQRLQGATDVMGRVQTRRSISVSKALYERIKLYCEIGESSMSSFIEARVNEYFAELDKKKG